MQKERKRPAETQADGSEYDQNFICQPPGPEQIELEAAKPFIT